MTLEQQQDVLKKTLQLLTDFCGKPPRGSVAPWWETSQEGVDMLLSHGVEYITPSPTMKKRIAHSLLQI